MARVERTHVAATLARAPRCTRGHRPRPSRPFETRHLTPEACVRALFRPAALRATRHRSATVPGSSHGRAHAGERVQGPPWRRLLAPRWRHSAAWEATDMADPGRIRYVESDGLQIAYQVVGSGPVDVVYVPGLANHIESMWDIPEIARFTERLASYSRLILIDKR